MSNGAGNRTAITNDVEGLRQLHTSPSGRQTTIDTFDEDGNLLSQDVVGDGQTMTTVYSYDAVGRLLSSTDPLGHTTTTTYNALGDVLSISDFNGNTRHYTYSARGERLTETGPDGSVVSTNTYDERGNLIRRERADGSTQTATYL